jgi:predicted dehydrogenase
MNTDMSRRGFIKTAGAAAVMAAAMPAGVFAAEEKPITLAFVGGAHIHTPSFIDLVSKRKDVKVKYMWDHDAARAEKRAKSLKCPVATDARQIWEDSEVQAVVICSETTRHPELVAAAAKAGKHMFVEKPLGFTAKESYSMAKAITKANLLFTTGYFMRTDAKHLFLRDEIAKGHFGKITRLVGSNCHSGSLGGWFDSEWRWMANPKIAGVGGFGDLGTHMLDIMIWLSGAVESATADIKVVTGRYGDCDESGIGLLKFKNGATGSLSAGWVDIDDPVTLLISGTEAHATINKGKLYYRCEKVEGADGNKPFTALPPSPPAPLEQFLNAVSGKAGMPLVTPEEAAVRVSVMEAMYRGNRSRSWAKPA